MAGDKRLKCKGVTTFLKNNYEDCPFGCLRKTIESANTQLVKKAPGSIEREG